MADLANGCAEEPTGLSRPQVRVDPAAFQQFGVGSPIRPVITANPPSVRGPDDINLARYINWFNPAGTDLWPMANGPNEVRFQVNSAGAGTRVRMAFTPRCVVGLKFFH